MIRRAIFSFALIAALLGASSSVDAAVTQWQKFRSQVVILSFFESGGQLIVQGDIRSRHPDCLARRRVGLFLGGSEVAQVKSRRNGQFTLTAPAVPGQYTVIAFTHARECPIWCKRADTTFVFEGQPPS